MPKSPHSRRRFASIITAAVLTTGGISIGIAGTAHAATRLGPVDMQRGCDTQWPGYGLTAHVNNPNDAYSWRCWAPWDHNTYTINVKAECITQYGNGAYQGLGNARDPYSWYCQR